MPRRDSMSNRALRKLCQFWLRPEVPLFEGEDSAARAEGDDLHDLAAANINGVDEDGICSSRAAEMWAGLKPLLDRLRARPHAEVLAEVSFGYNPRTFESRVIGVGISREERDAIAQPGEYTGTADVVMLFRDASGKVVSIEVADHKTTWAGGEPQDATEQLVTYAAIAADAYGVTEALVYPIYVTPLDARLGDGIYLDSLALESELLSITEEQLADVSHARPNPGPWCAKRYCKARANCPATKEAVAIVVGESLEPSERMPAGYVPGAGIRDLRPEDMPKLYVTRKLLEEAVAAIKADERAWLSLHNEIVFADGSRIVWQRQQPESAALSSPRAMEILEAAGAQSAVKASLTWAELERAIGKEKAEKVREELRAAGFTKKGDFFKPVHRAAPKVKLSPAESFDKRVKESLEAAGLPAPDADGGRS